MDTNVDSMGRPDPSILTTQSLMREVAVLRELIDSELRVRDTRLDGMDKALELAQDYPTNIEKAVKEVKDFYNSRIDSVKEANQEQIRSRDQAIAKSETAITKQIDALMTLLQTTTKATDDKIDDIKLRQTSTEGQTKGAGVLWGYIIGGVGTLIAIISVTTMLLTKI